ncbi:ABC transporter permease [Parapedobacter lycopersici]|uniref:ABC transporter permease n=1 Tax=Parapedobacter lycopersici TaxID=1864939 RepID=UPI00214D895D|nr:ABC transporter permease [Parapedobacter lycopersici]
MIKTYFKIAWRNLAKNKKSAIINIVGLALGMAVFILIALWVWDELSFDKYHENYDRIGQVVQTQTFSGEQYRNVAVPFPLGEELKTQYGDYFQYVTMASWPGEHVLSQADKLISEHGIFMDAEAPRMLSLAIVEGSIDGLANPNSIMLAESTAKAIFGDENPLEKVLKINQQLSVTVTAVYQDLPDNTSFANIRFIAPWALYVTSESWILNQRSNWDNNSFQLFVQLRNGVTLETVNRSIVDVKRNRVDEERKKLNPLIAIQPMKDWHLKSEGIMRYPGERGGSIKYVRLFSVIGVFVLLLACINFMNLSTARSEKRAKEVGIRKTVGSPRQQLILQFLSESVLTACMAFLFAILLVFVLLPWFNGVAGKKLEILWTNGWFWVAGIVFSLFTGIIAGSYPAFYLSSFNPLTVLKGTFRIGWMAGLPRKILVVVQFSVSVALIIGTIVVFRQIQHTKDRPVGYNRDRLMMVEMKTSDFYGKFDVLRSQLKEKGAIEELSESSSPMTAVWSNQGGFTWPGKDPALQTDVATIWVTHEFGKTVDWQIREGRDFSREFGTDSTAVIINEAAAKYMGVADPVGMTITAGDLGGGDYHIIGVVNDLIMDSPFQPVKQTFYFMNYGMVNWINLKLNARKSTAECLALIEQTFREVIPNAPFEYQFVDEGYAAKFAQEERIGKLATFFATLAIVISCLGIFGLASFVAEQRTKEIGIRKVVGASIFQLWRLLSTNFVILVLISCLVASPVAYYFLEDWLQNYEYRATIPWWVFAVAMGGALLITMLIVSLQTIRAARMNPVESLRDE